MQGGNYRRRRDPGEKCSLLCTICRAIERRKVSIVVGMVWLAVVLWLIMYWP